MTDVCSGEVERLKALLAQRDEMILSMRAEIDGLRLALEVLLLLLLLLLPIDTHAEGQKSHGGQRLPRSQSAVVLSVARTR